MDFSKRVDGHSLIIRNPSVNVQELVRFLRDHTHITKLSILACEIGDKGAKALAEGNFPNLTELHLEGNNITSEGLEALIKGNFPNLTTLNLNENKIDVTGVQALITASSEVFPKLTNLNLHDNNIDNKDAGALVEALDNGIFPKLKECNINGNCISDELIERLDYMIKNRSQKGTVQMGNKLPFVIASAGLLLSLSISYFAGAAALTPVATAISVFLAAAVVGTLVGYSIGKFYKKVSEEKQKDLDTSTLTAVKSVLCSVFTKSQLGA
ncbi:AAA ATPase family protein [Wolbachia endosymbiont of Armadillidium vulgare str. wVulC]|uniref:leucine-rich repeat domain-containing protein n=1 Tax=Wolbachia endosymbiont of Armadillidium vulgare TaxID=77039 RepID=UPI0006D4C4E8|nr:leucine-rich repeat domain-containing protein [Wolbachia endosymbiont of Armadillidium vulgare]KLT22518.1 AAA ATPase family protein [Wolbachia endosymbiont of Armadillidium vulgare str. wVulC]